MSLWFRLRSGLSLESKFGSQPSTHDIYTETVHLISVKISQNINTDEAAVLGAAFYGASLSRQFRTKKIKLQDISTHDIQTSYETEGKNGTAFLALAHEICALRMVICRKTDDPYLDLPQVQQARCQEDALVQAQGGLQPAIFVQDT